MLVVTVHTDTAYLHLFHAAVKISLRHAASVIILDMHKSIFLFPKKHWHSISCLCLYNFTGMD